MTDYKKISKISSFNGETSNGGKIGMKFLLIAIILGLLVGFFGPFKVFKKKVIKKVVV